MAEYIIAKYIRLSIEDSKTDSLSVENQRLMLDKRVEEMNIPGVKVLEFVDNGHSGMNFERPAVQELLELVQLGRVNCIMVKDFSRFGRSLTENGYYIERIFPLYRIRFIAVSDAFDSDKHEGGTGGLDVAFKFLIHEQYSRDLSRKISSAKRVKALRGECVIKNCAFGFKKVNHRLEIDEPAAETVRLIFELYNSGRRLSEIAARLCSDKHPTPGEHKRRVVTPSCSWSASHISSILRDEQYIGTYIAGKTKVLEIGSNRAVQVDESEWIRIPGHHPAIVGKAVFEAVRERMGQKNEPQRKQKLGARQRSGTGKHVRKSGLVEAQAVLKRGELLSSHPEQQAQVEKMQGTKRALYERFILGEIDVHAFKAGNLALDIELSLVKPAKSILKDETA